MSGHALLAMAMLTFSGALAYLGWSTSAASRPSGARAGTGPFADWSND